MLVAINHQKLPQQKNLLCSNMVREVGSLLKLYNVDKVVNRIYYHMFHLLQDEDESNSY